MNFWWRVLFVGVTISGMPCRGKVSCGEVSLGMVWRGKVNMKTLSKSRLTEIGGESPTNGAESGIDLQKPYTVSVSIEGVSPILFHRWNNESVAAKSAAKKGSAEKKSDDIGSYVYRDDDGHLCIPGEYLRGAIVAAAKFIQDPRSPRKSASDLFKAAVISLTPLASLGVKDWDYIDQRRVTIQRNSITRSRPAMKEGWKASFEFMVNLPEYVNQSMLNSTIQSAGRLIGIADFRPTFGRFNVVSFEILK